MNALLGRLIRIINKSVTHKVEFMQYDDFYEIEEIGSGGYGTVYTAKYKHKIVNRYNEEIRKEQVVLKKFKNIDKNAELFISEVSIHT